MIQSGVAALDKGDGHSQRTAPWLESSGVLCIRNYHLEGVLVVGAVLLLAVASAPCCAQVVIRHFEFETPRDFGYFIGDVVRHRVHLELSRPYRLDSTQLPKAGRYDLWLEMAEPVVHEEAGSDHLRYEIELLYRIVNNPDTTQLVITPSIPLLAQGQGRSLTKDTPAWAFTLSPLAMPGFPRQASLASIRPDRPPPGMRLALVRTGFGVTLAALFGVLVFLYHLRFGLPGSARRQLPFARACRDLRALARQPSNGTLYAHALQRFHQAVNEAAGRAVFLGDLEGFFAGQPQFQALRPGIETLFERSAELFFGQGVAPEPQVGDFQSLLQLAHACRRVEC